MATRQMRAKFLKACRQRREAAEREAQKLFNQNCQENLAAIIARFDGPIRKCRQPSERRWISSRGVLRQRA